MAEDQDERTEQATGRKRKKARQEGNVPRSRDLTGLMPIWAIFLYLSFSGAFLASLATYMKGALKRGFQIPVNEATLVHIFKEDAAQVGVIMAPVFGLILIAVAAVHFLQTGFLVTVAPLSPDFSKLNPIKGIGRFFSLNNLFETIKGVLKILVLGTLLYLIIRSELVKIPLLIDMDMQGIMGFSFEQIRKLFLISVIILTLFSAADYGYQRWQYERNLRMTKQEVKEEHKETDGDPQVKARIRSLQREMARKRMMQEVPKADVVITNPTHYAVALKYDAVKMGAPTVVAKGANLIAENIKQLARKHGVPVYEDKPLARTLFKLDLGQEIPATLYRALATILAGVYKLKGRR
ncbi:MAG: flagellar biosynthesis protein FlhB [Thermodesulfovibrionales bacterium]